MRFQKINEARPRGETFKILLLFFLFFAIWLPPVTGAQTTTKISGSGSNWNLNIDSTNLIAGAGSDLTGSYETATNYTTLDVTCNSSYRVWIKRVDTTWDSANFSLYLIRTNDGTSGEGSITSPPIGTPVIVTTNDTVFFSGFNSRSGITVQYQLTGISIQTEPNNYRTLVSFSITSP